MCTRIHTRHHYCPVNFSELPVRRALPCRVSIKSIRDMNWKPLPETRCKYVHVRSDAASVLHTVSGNGSQSMHLTVNGTAVTRHRIIVILLASLNKINFYCVNYEEASSSCVFISCHNYFSNSEIQTNGEKQVNKGSYMNGHEVNTFQPCGQKMVFIDNKQIRVMLPSLISE